MKRNIGTTDKILRLLAGTALTILAATGTIGWWGWLGLILIATGLMSFCAFYALLGIRTCPADKP